MKKLLFPIILVIILAFTPVIYGCSSDNGALPEITPPSGSLPEDTLPERPEQPENPELPEPPPPPPVTPEPEPEPVPPATPDPEPPKPSIPQGDVLVRSDASALSVRSGAGTGYSIIGQMDKNDMLAYEGEVNGWYKVLFKNGYGYVSKSYCTLVGFSKGSAKVENVILYGKKLMGLPYVFGAQRYHWGNGNLNTAFDGKSYDCSSLTQYVYKKGADVNIGTTSRDQSQQGTYLSKESVRRGDLMFFTNDSRQHLSGLERIGHVGMYLGDNYILHTASDYAVIEPISAKRWSYFINGRRLI